MAQTLADLIERKIISGILAINNGKKTPTESKVQSYIDKLTKYNQFLAEDFNTKFVIATRKFNDARA